MTVSTVLVDGVNVIMNRSKRTIGNQSSNLEGQHRSTTHTQSFLKGKTKMNITHILEIKHDVINQNNT
jgi:hypothetical protein